MNPTNVRERVLIAHQPHASRAISAAVHASSRYVIAQSGQEIPSRPNLVSAHIAFVLGSVGAIRNFIREPRVARTNGGIDPILVLVINADELGDALDIVDACDGILFFDMNLQHAGEILLLAKQHFMSIPQGLLSSVVTDQLRSALLRNLSTRELRVLILIGRALTNEQIAAFLSVSTPTIKNLTRAVLSTLRFRNRTEAAVFLSRRRSNRRPQYKVVNR